jgi:hypothetical protein
MGGSSPFRGQKWGVRLPSSEGKPALEILEISREAAGALGLTPRARGVVGKAPCRGSLPPARC